MTDVPIYGGATKGYLIRRAYGICGQSTAQFELEPEELNQGLDALNDLMAMLLAEGIDLGYDTPDPEDNGSPEEASGIPSSANTAVSYLLARDIASLIGKELGGAAKAQAGRSISTLRAQFMVIPTMDFGRQTIRGAGNRYYGRWSPFFPVATDTTDI